MNKLCYPEPFHPGVDAKGYCWNDPEDDSGNVPPGAPNWTPQGFSVPHTATTDGVYPATTSHRWEVVSMYDSAQGHGQAKLRFVYRGTNASSPSMANYFDVLLVRVYADGSLQPVKSHVDGVVWFEENLLVASGGSLQVYSLDNFQRSSDPAALGYEYVLPMTLSYLSFGKSEASCNALATASPCLNSLSFDRARRALVSGEFKDSVVTDVPRIVQWPFDFGNWLPRADTGAEFGDATAAAAWSNTLLRTQGVVYRGGTFYISAACPPGYDNGYREASCVYTAVPGGRPTVLTSVPDMTQNLDWDASVGRLRGVNEVVKTTAVNHNQRLVFDFKPTAASVTTFRLKNVNSGKCLLPYSAGLNNNATVVQFTCNGTNSQDWYWAGTEIRNFQSKRCLSVKDASSSNGALLVQYDCNGYATQDWTVQNGLAGGAVLQNLGNGLCATPSGGSVNDNAAAVQWVCNLSHPTHAWIGSAK